MTADLRQHIVSCYRNGELQNLVCPVCDGGRGGEKSFNIFEVDDSVLGYKCHRSSCGATGRVPLLGEVRGSDKPKHSATLTYTKPTDKDRELYASQFGLTDPTVVIASTDRRWFLVDLRKHDGSRYGWQRRIIDKTELFPKEPKAKTHKDERYPLAFFRNSPFNHTLVVVEDPWSAMRIERIPSLRCDAAAICGGDWTRDAASLVAGKYRQVVLALDRDAQRKAVQQALQWQHIQQVRVVVPRVDFKNMDDEEIIQTLA
jgi:hypothetical protein